MPSSGRVDLQTAFLLHTWAYRESSLLLDIFTPEFGRLRCVARGARRPRAVLHGILLPFQPLLLSWFGKGEVKTLHQAEWQAGIPQLGGDALWCGFYLNELLQRLLPVADPHPSLFFDYQMAIHSLAHNAHVAITVRRFEMQLLRHLGYAPNLTREAASGEPVNPQRWYVYVPEQGAVCLADPKASLFPLQGQTLLAMAADDFSHPQTRQQGRHLLRRLLNHYLGTTPLHSRQLLAQLLALQET